MMTRLGMVRPGVVMPRPLNYESDLLFHFRAADLLLGNDPSEDVLTALTGEAPTFSRASAGGYTRDALGFLTQWGQSVPRIEMYDVDGDGYWEEPGWLTEGPSENVALRSEDFGNAAWQDIGTPTITANDADGPDRTATAEKIEDNDAGETEGVFQAVAIADDSTTWCISIFIKKAPAGAPVVRFGASMTGGSAPAAFVWFDPITGDSITSDDLVDSGVIEYATYWRVWFTLANDSSGNTGLNFSVSPAGRLTGDLGAGSADATAVGSNHFWGFQAENLNFPSSYISTVGSAVTRLGEITTYVGPWLGQTIVEELDDLTFYVRLPRPVHADTTGDIALVPGIVLLSATVSQAHLGFQEATREVRMKHETAGADSTVTTAIPSGDVLEIVGQVKNMRTGASVALDVGSGLSAFSGTSDAVAAWGDTTIRVMHVSSYLWGSLFDLKVARGLRTMKQMQEAF